MDCVLIAVCAKLLQLHAARRVATVLLGGVARNAVGALIGVSAALSAFKRDYKTDAFCHGFRVIVYAVFDYATRRTPLGLPWAKMSNRTVSVAF